MRGKMVMLIVAGFFSAIIAANPVFADCQDDCKKAFVERVARCDAAAEAGAQVCKDNFPNDPKGLAKCLKKVKKSHKRCLKEAKKALAKCLDACP